MTRPAWLNRAVIGMGITSFLSDAGHEMVTTLLPAFLTLIGTPAAALGLIEGVADATSSFVKLWAGWYTDRVGRRKELVVGGSRYVGREGSPERIEAFLPDLDELITDGLVTLERVRVIAYRHDAKGK